MERPSSKSRPPRSLEALIDEENRAVLAALDWRRQSSPMAKPKLARGTTPPPIRSMLDVDSPPPRHGSIAGIGVGITNPSAASRKAAELDPADPSTWTSPHSSKPNSPVLTKSLPVSARARTSSETDRPVGLPKIEADDKRDFEHTYQFDMASIPSSVGSATRATTDAKRPRDGPSTAGPAPETADFSSLHVGHAAGADRKRGSRSPASSTRSPDASKTALLSPSAAQPTSPIQPLTTQAGTVVDDQAHRRLSNKSNSFSTVTDDSEEASTRVAHDAVGAEEALAESSDEEHPLHSSDEDEARGRSERRANSLSTVTDPVAAPQPNGRSVPDEEKKAASVNQSVKSLLEPSISITSPTGERVAENKPGEAPAAPSAAVLPSVASLDDDDDDDDEAAAIKKAKSLALNVSPLDSTVPDRHVRIILRGDWVHFHQESEEGRRTSRLYLVCSDLSVEATYAMEWVVGTMLRDGDTLLAIYALEDESAGKATEAEREVLQAEGAKAGRDASEVMDTLTRQTTQGEGTSVGPESKNRYIPATEAESLTGSVDARRMSKRDLERLRGVEDITQNFLKLVRRTTLQVRCMVEVIHCKSPKHLILGAIDELEPTLCVVGTRGRNSLKGVLLGSFSNYLVTKSSVPVMVARKRLKKPRSQVRVSSTKIRLTNNLTASALSPKRKSLTQARID